MATFYFSPRTFSSKPFSKATHTGDVSFFRNPQKDTLDSQLSYDFEEYRQGEESLNENSLLEFFERNSPESVYSISLNIHNNGMSLIEIRNIVEI